jgi:hypothetical protein
VRQHSDDDPSGGDAKHSATADVAGRARRTPSGALGTALHSPVGFVMHSGDLVSIQKPHDACPCCSAPSGAPGLLTSMTRYYVCGRCACRWQVARDQDGDHPLTHDLECAADQRRGHDGLVV